MVAGAAAAAAAAAAQKATAGAAKQATTGAAKQARRMHIPLSTRLKAWWLGAENVEVYARFGERSGLHGWFMEWKTSLVALSCVAVLLFNRANNRLAHEALENAEMNRARFYKRDFEPTYAPHPTKGIYDGAIGYQYHDAPTGLMVNADNKFVGPNRDELKEVFATNPPPISKEMMLSARQLRDAHVSEKPSS